MPDYYEESAEDYYEKTFSIDTSTFLMSIVERLKHGFTILDVGCGSQMDVPQIPRSLLKNIHR